MITLIDHNAVNTKEYRCDFGCDTKEDVAKLPTVSDLSEYGLPKIKAAPWSMAIVAADKSMYYKTEEGTWKMIGVQK